jgi:hypothetical protein
MSSFADNLLIPLVVVVLDELSDRPWQVVFPEENHSTETLVLDRAHESCDVGVHVRRMEWGLDHSKA